MKKKNFIVIDIILLVLFIVGAGIFMYPAISDYVNYLKEQREIKSYDQVITELSAEEVRMLEEAEEYNKNHSYNYFSDIFSSDSPIERDNSLYESLLNPTGDGMMGYVEIPAVEISIPIYHGTSDKILQKGAGHMEGTSLPVGGESSHAVLVAHTGLPTERLFTDIDRLKEGDLFKIQILSNLYTYEVDQIVVVLPDELDELKIKEGEDYLTLLTCTPYGINSHRLLVRGHRIENPESEVDEPTLPSKFTFAKTKLLKLCLGAAFLVVAVTFWILSMKKPKKK